MKKLVDLVPVFLFVSVLALGVLCMAETLYPAVLAAGAVNPVKAVLAAGAGAFAVWLLWPSKGDE